MSQLLYACPYLVRIANAKMYAFVGTFLVVVLAGYWLYLGMPTTWKGLGEAAGITKAYAADTTAR